MSSPKPAVAELWGSRSTSNTSSPSSASPAPKLIAVVVFPVPPFWFEIAIVGTFILPEFYLFINKTICIFNTLTMFHPVCKRGGFSAATPLGLLRYRQGGRWGLERTAREKEGVLEAQQ